MNSKASKTAPLLFLLLLTLTPLTFAPITATNYSAPVISGSNAPDIATWIQDASKYASYNGHFSVREWGTWEYVGSNFDAILVANLTVKPAGTGHSNISVGVYEFFTAKFVQGVSGLWYNISTATGYVADSNSHSSDLNGFPCFFYLPNADSLNVDDTVKISTPFYDKPLNFRVNRTETILGIQTIQLLNETSLMEGSGSSKNWFDCDIALWVSKDTNGLLMRVKAWEQHGYSDEYSQSNHYTGMSMQVFRTNILALTLPPMPTSQAVPWMRPGRFIQYNLQGSGYIDPKITNITDPLDPDVWELPLDTKFKAWVSSNVTMKVERATTGWVEPWGDTRWVWVVHVMLNNTKLLLPDFRRGVEFMNETFGLNIPESFVDTALSQMSSFNKTGLVTEMYFIVDNATGIMFAPGMRIEAPETFDPAKYDLGTWLSRGYAFLVLQYFAQSFLSETWSQSISLTTSDLGWPETPMRLNDNVTMALAASLNASARVVGTEYLTFPGGGGGNCWKLVNSVNASGSVIMKYNETLTIPAANATVEGATSGYIDIEKYSGFPLSFTQHLSVNTTGNIVFPDFIYEYIGIKALNWTVGLGLDLSAIVPRSNIMWMSYETKSLLLGAGVNGTYGSFSQYGFHVTLNGANATDVDITGSATPPPDTGAPPSGSISLIFLDIKGEFLPGTNVITLYVYINRTKALELGMDEYSLRLYTWNATSALWEEILDPTGHPASSYVYINATEGCIVGYLYHLSYFAVLGTTTGGGGGGMSTTLILIAAVAVIAVAAAVVVLKRRKH